jgi:hypothetical protein
LDSTLAGCIKGNFDVAIHGNFAVVAAVISDENGNIILAITQKLTYSDALLVEVSAALLTSQVAASSDCRNLFLEGDALLVILAINNPPLFSYWSFANCISDISLVLSSFHSWNALKVSRNTNFWVHCLAKWVASNHVFESILIGSHIFSSIRIISGKNPTL